MTKSWFCAFAFAAAACVAAPALAAEPTLQLSGAGVRAAALTMSDLQTLKPVEAKWTAAGGSRTVVGVPLDKLLERQGLVPGRMGDDGTEHGKGWRRVVVASATDGFQAVFSVAELTEQMGATRALVAWKLDGKPLPADRGPFRLVVLTDKVASRSVHALNRLEVIQLGATGGGSPDEHRPPPNPATAPNAAATTEHRPPPTPPTAGAATTEHGSPPNPTTGPHSAVAAHNADEGLARVAEIHGAAGPFAVAGYRMGQRALRELGLPEGSLDLEVRHESPAEVQWSCIADGAQASTGASAGKLNLTLQKAARPDTRTTFRRKSTGKTITFTLTPTFIKRYLDTPRPHLLQAGTETMHLPDDSIFILTH